MHQSKAIRVKFDPLKGMAVVERVEKNTRQGLLIKKKTRKIIKLNFTESCYHTNG
jgi:hypothetical protein